MFKRYFIAGLLIWVPLVVTIWVLSLFVNTLDRILLWLPTSLHPDKLIGYDIPGGGVVLTLVILLLTGMFATNFVGEKLFSWWEQLLSRIPVVKSVYVSVKQVSDTLFSSNGQAFRHAVLIEYPRKSCWTVAFLTGKPQGEVETKLAEKCADQGEMVSVYVPTTPNPTSGFFLIVAKSDIVELGMSIDEAFKYVVSMGVVAPGKSRTKNLAKP